MKQWPHSPSRLAKAEGIYIVTAATLHKQPLFKGRCELIHDQLLETALEFGWRLEAWALFPNHYHFVAHSPEGESNLAKMTSKLHACTAREINKMDGVAGRKVWFSYWHTKLTYERSYLARLNYVHRNAVKHGLVQDACDYPWCSAAWFERHADRAWQEVVGSFPVDRVKVPDDF